MFDEYHSQLISALQQGRYIKNRTEGNVLEMRQGLSLTIPCQQSSSLIFMVHYAFMNDLAHQYSQFHYRNYQPSERISLLRNNLSKLLFFQDPVCALSAPLRTNVYVPVKYSVIGCLQLMIFIYLWFIIYYYAFCSSPAPRDKCSVYQQTITQAISAEGEVNIYFVHEDCLCSWVYAADGAALSCCYCPSQLYLTQYYESYLHALFLCLHTCSWIIFDVSVR